MLKLWPVEFPVLELDAVLIERVDIDDFVDKADATDSVESRLV